MEIIELYFLGFFGIFGLQCVAAGDTISILVTIVSNCAAIAVVGGFIVPYP